MDQEKPVEPEVIPTPEEVVRDVDGESSETAVEQPAKVMRVGTMMRQLLEEVRAATLDEASRGRLR